MHIIKLNAIGSTNSYLKDMAVVKLPKDYTVVVAEHQTKGRGQMGTVWQSESSKNLTFSLFKRLNGLKVEEQFFVSMAISLAIYKTLNTFLIPKLNIKWPNDILAEQKKVCGILIENILKQNKFEGCVIGIGLNVNQKFFDDLPQATSMSLLTGTLFDTDEVLAKLLHQIEYYLDLVTNRKLDILKKTYETYLFRNHKISTFKSELGEVFTGIIKGVNNQGQLKVLLENDVLNTYNFKEITILY